MSGKRKLWVRCQLLRIMLLVEELRFRARSALFLCVSAVLRANFAIAKVWRSFRLEVIRIRHLRLGRKMDDLRREVDRCPSHTECPPHLSAAFIKITSDLMVLKQSLTEFNDDHYYAPVEGRLSRAREWTVKTVDAAKQRLSSLLRLTDRTDSDTFLLEVTAWVFWPTSQRDNALGDVMQRFHSLERRKGPDAARSYLKREVTDAVCKRLGRLLLVAKLVEFVVKHFRD